MVVCAYVDMLNLESHIRDHKFFRQAAEIAIEIYLHLCDYPLSENDKDQFANLGRLFFQLFFRIFHSHFLQLIFRLVKIVN